MRTINKIIVHCSASDSPAHDDISVIRQWHIARGFNGVGYHFFIKKNGEIQDGRPLGIVGAHCQGFNAGSVGVCFHGLNHFSNQQVDAIQTVIAKIEKAVGKKLEIKSHNDFTTKKTCPNFVLSDFLKKKLTIIKTYPVKAGFLLNDDAHGDICDLGND